MGQELHRNYLRNQRERGQQTVISFNRFVNLTVLNSSEDSLGHFRFHKVPLASFYWPHEVMKIWNREQAADDANSR